MQVSCIYFNYYQAERNLGGNPHPECGINVVPEGVSRFPTTHFNAVAFPMDDVCRTAYKRLAKCEDCTEPRPCFFKHKLKIHGEFKGVPGTSVLIRTLDPFNQVIEGLHSYLEKVGVSLDKYGKAIKTRRLLGDVDPIKISFDQQGNSYIEGGEKNGIIELTINSADIWGYGICTSWQLWQWQYSTDEGKTWKAAGGLFHEGVSIHRIFITKKPATWPWTGYNEKVKTVSGDPASSRPMYIDALEWACKWAEGETTEEGIAAKITARLNDGTGDRFKYEKTGSNNYTSLYSKYFDCSRFIDRLNGKFGRGPNVNCVDTAHMVISLANVLGCNLKPGKIQNFPESSDDPVLPFKLNRNTLIGYTEPAEDGHTFNFHQVACIPGADDDTPDRIYDACIKFDEKSFEEVKNMDSAPDPSVPTPPELEHRHPVDLPLGSNVFTYGYVAILAKQSDESSQKDLSIDKSEEQNFSISALKSK